MGRFVEGFAALDRSTLDAVTSLLSAVDSEDASQSAWASSLNGDGFPLQACLTASRAGRKLRLLADPAAAEPDPVRRLCRGRAALDRLLARLPGERMRLDFLRALEECLPGESVLPGLRNGALWLATDLDRRGCAAYVTARCGLPRERWARALNWLDRWIGPGAVEGLRALPSVAEVAGVGVEVAADRRPSAKVYFRLLRPAALTLLGPPFSADDGLGLFLRQTLADHAVRRSGLVFSVSGEFAGNTMSDGKVDVCSHCTPRTPSEWACLLDQVVRQQGLMPFGLDEVLLGGRLQPAFVGLGVAAGGARRLNVYLSAGSGAADQGP